MAKDRNSVCKHYICHGQCAISNKPCTVAKEMQHCHMYEPIKEEKTKIDRGRARKAKEKERRAWD